MWKTRPPTQLRRNSRSPLAVSLSRTFLALFILEDKNQAKKCDNSNSAGRFALLGHRITTNTLKMNSRTYKYDALAAEVKLKDVTSCRHNRALLHRIKNNDPGITHLSLVSDVLVNGIGRANDDEFIVREDDDEDSFGWLGYFVT